MKPGMNFYVFFSWTLLLISIPLFFTLALLIFFLSGPPVLFLQKRIGKNGKSFVLYKFRTMEPNAEREQQNLRRFNEADGPAFKIYHDPRFTRIGKFLAHTGLDELPQLFNVLRGDMSLFGPRPLPMNEAKKLKAWQKKRHTIKPGIISPWILNGYHAQSFEAWMKSDIAYIQKKSWAYDTRLALRTVKLLVRLLFREVASH